jgi:hypothetical protein
VRIRSMCSVAASTLLTLLFVSFCYGQTISSSALVLATEVIKRDFSLIGEIRTISMSEKPDDRFDIIVVGAKRGKDPEWAGWRVEVFSVKHRRVLRTWDSEVSARGVEFEDSRVPDIDIRPEEHDYDLTIEGCAHHACGDGIDGFLFFSGKTGKTFKAKVVAREQDQRQSGSPKYDVTFSQGITDEAKKRLQTNICMSTSVSFKQGLPFACKEH